MKTEKKVVDVYDNDRSIRVINGSLEEREGGTIILRGVLDTDTLSRLKTDDYQREVLSNTGMGGKRSSKLQRGIANGVTLPDIELGMRGQHFETKGKTTILHDAVYIIDGLQRVSAMLLQMAKLQEEGKEEMIEALNPLGATIHFNSTKEWEKQRFADLNQLRTPVSPNVLLRNSRDKHPSVLTAYGLTFNDPSFALYRRVCWNQRMGKGELLTASSLLRTAMALHRTQADGVTNSGKGPARLTSSGAATMSSLLDRVAKEVGLANFRQNIHDIFDLIDSCWGIRSVQIGAAHSHLRNNFLMTLAFFISRNAELWKDGDQKRMFVDTKTRQRLATFPIHDPEIRRLASGGTMVTPILYNYLLEHMNKGKSKHRLR